MKILAGLLLVGATAQAQQWIAPPDVKSDAIGVYSFRKVVEMPVVPKSVVVHVSADNRFLLYVNGERVGEGPARGDLKHWRYETFDLAPKLHAGKNVIAARVWNFGSRRPMAQNSVRAGLVVWSDAGVNTDASWEVRTETGWTTFPLDEPSANNFRTGPGESLDAKTYDWEWKSASDAAAWGRAVAVDGSAWTLVKDELPAMEYSDTAVGRVVLATGVKAAELAKTVVAAHSHATLLLDRGEAISAYPSLTISGGAGARVALRYTEALVDAKGEKGNRNEIAGRHVEATLNHDEFLPDGGKRRTFTPLWWRVWRYMEVDVETGDQALTLDALTAKLTEYPMVQRASFHCDDAELNRIWDAGWKTLRLDAHETFMDSAFWEQLQYIGDARIESMVTYAVSGDDRLPREMMVAMAESVTADGLTASRYPTTRPQVIPPFSLLWIGAMHDFWMYRPKTEQVKDWLAVERSVLAWFAKYQRADGLLGKLPEKGYGFWEFLDWADAYKAGSATQEADGGSIPLSLQFAQAEREAADLEEAYGDASRAAEDRAAAAKTVAAAYALGWDAGRGMLADTPAKTSFGEQANILGVMTDAIPTGQQKSVLASMLRDEFRTGKMGASEAGVIPASFYFRYYLSRAMDHAGMDEEYLKTLQPWRAMLAMGLTTTAERPEPTRSDTHAWSAHPTVDMLTLVAGIRPAVAGFASVLIAPHLGKLMEVDAEMPHPAGMIRVEYRRKGDRLEAEIEMPEGVAGTFEWEGQRRVLVAGKQKILFELGTPTHRN